MSASLPAGAKPDVNPWFIAIAVMLATFMEVLDTSVANVALNHIAGNLSASTDEATWVLTSYLVSNAVVLPATQWLSRFFGRKRFLITCIVIFTISSALCGLASGLGMLILARIIQGGRWSATTDRAVNSSGKLSARETGVSYVGVRDRRGGCADSRSNGRRMVNG
jgi:MFS transporter, DHA2 family, multidrug resistance protein